MTGRGQGVGRGVSVVERLRARGNGSTQEAVAPFRHNRNIVDWDVKSQLKQTKLVDGTSRMNPSILCSGILYLLEHLM